MMQDFIDVLNDEFGALYPDAWSGVDTLFRSD